MTTATDERITTRQIAARLGVSHNTISRLASRWHGHGSGHHIALTHQDALVLTAWCAINARRSVSGDHGGGWLNRTAERAIRTGHPRRYLFLTRSRTSFHDTWTDAYHAWAADPDRVQGEMPWVIDLDPETDPA